MAADGYVLKGKHIEEIFQDQNIQELSAAAARGDVEKVREIVRSGVDPNVEGKERVTPLIWAFIGESRVGMETLIDSGADPNFKVSNGASAVSLSMRSANPEWLSFFLEHGGDPNAVDERGDPLIVKAVSPPGSEHLRILLTHGADINKPARDGSSAILVAAALRRFDLIYVLLESGADISVKAAWGGTLASLIGSSRIVRGTPAERTEQREWRQKVEHLLRERGIEIPYTDSYL